MTTFDGRTFALGWLSVACATGDDDATPQLYRTICAETFPDGIRLVATDSYWLATTFVHNTESDGLTEPDLNEAPDTIHVVRDVDKRGAGLLAYVNALTGKKDADPIELRVVIAKSAEEATLSSDLAAAHLVLEIPGHEKVILDTYDGAYPTWRTLDTSWKGASATVFAMGPRTLPGLAKLQRLWPSSPAEFKFAGARKPARFHIPDSEPAVSGLVMPARATVAEQEDAA